MSTLQTAEMKVKKQLCFGAPLRPEIAKPAFRFPCTSTCRLTLLTTAVAVFAFTAKAQWIQTEPIGRAHTATAYIQSTNQMILFGGNDQTGADYNDVWKLNAANDAGRGRPSWSQVAPRGTVPSPRTASSGVYDPSSDRFMVFGGGLGQSSPCVSEVWVLTNASSASGSSSWIQLTPAGTQPPPRLFHSAVYDPTTNRMVIYGGNNCFQTDYADAWVLSNANGLGGTPTWSQLTPSGSAPIARDYPTAVYDSVSNVMTIFGGESESGVVLGDVWALSNANGSGGSPSWTLLAPSGPAIPPRAGHTATYDASSNRMTVFGGANATDLNDTWVLLNANGEGGTPEWMQLGPFSPSPLPTAFARATFDPRTNRMTIFGGITDSNCYLNTVWVLAHANGL